MPRSRQPRENRRNFKLAVRLLPRQRRKVKRAARAAGVTVSAYLIRLIDARQSKRTVVEPPADLVPFPLLAQWQRAGNNVNQIARAMNRGRDPHADWIVGVMKELLTLMIEDQITRRFAIKYGAARIKKHFAAAG